MKSALNYLKNNALLIGGFIILLIALIEYLKNLIPRYDDTDRVVNTSTSKDDSVDRVIKILDDALGTFGAFNSSHKWIFDNIRSLTREQIYLLHKDFGTRKYIRATRSYEIYDMAPIIQSKILNLTQIYYNELDEAQLSRLKTIYESKAIRDLL